MLCLLIVSCANVGGDMTAVTIDLGLDKKTSQKEMSLLDRFINFFSLGTEAMADSPSDLTSITIKVKGPGMGEAHWNLTPNSGIIKIYVPAGKSREFSVVGNTVQKDVYCYEGSAISDLNPGDSVMLSIDMLKSYKPEGTPENPIFVPLNNFANKHKGHVGTGKSYYYTTGENDQFFFIYIENLTDDGDIIDYGSDSTYTTIADKPSIGRTMFEKLSNSYYVGNLYFTVDGSKTGYHTDTIGTEYTIYIESHGGSVSSNMNEGTMGSPKLIPLIPPGWQYYGMCGLDPGGESYYRATVKAGITYWFNNNQPTVIQKIYSDQFVTEILSFPYTPGSDEVFIHADGSNTMFQIRIVTNEGSVSNPVYLFPEKTNYAEAGVGSSYYLFEVTQGSSYDITVFNIYKDVDLYVFDDTGFTNQVGLSENAGDGVDESVLDLNATSNVLGLRIDNKTAVPSTYIITVTLN